MALSLKINILVLEQEKEDLIFLKAQIKESACNVILLSEDDKVIPMLAKHDFAIIFIMVNSDYDKSISLVRRIREAEKSKYTPVIFISEYKMEDDVILKGYNAGVVDYLVLPVKNEIIEAKIRAFTEIFRLRLSAETIAAMRLKNSEQKYITEQTLLAEKLRQSQKMESIGTIAGGIAHDFNNILGAIIGYAQLAKYNIPDGNPASEDIDSIIAASDRAKELVTHILSFSRLSKQLMQPVHLHHVVNEVFKLIRATFPSTIDIIRNVSSHATSVMADSTEMHQVIMNLCTNAFHSMEKDGGVLEICLDSVDITTADLPDFPELKPGGYVKLSVCDTGCGIDPEIIGHIFDSYFTTKEKGIGTGLGLAVVHGIVKHHHGFIKVKSHVGVGTEINVFFPRIDSITRTRKNISDPILTGTETVLIVDDEPSLVYVEKSMLQKLGYRVISEASGADAFATFSKKPDFFDIVITDMTMPGMTGLELSKKIIELKANIPIILCTGYNNKITNQSAKETGIAKVLLKPLEIRELALAIRELVEIQPHI